MYILVLLRDSLDSKSKISGYGFPYLLTLLIIMIDYKSKTHWLF